VRSTRSHSGSTGEQLEVSLARLLGAVGRLAAMIGAPIRAVDAADRAETEACIAGALGPDAFASAVAEGRAMDLDHAVACALGEERF
jgi:hypothetical protein